MSDSLVKGTVKRVFIGSDLALVSLENNDLKLEIATVSTHWEHPRKGLLSKIMFRKTRKLREGDYIQGYILPDDNVDPNQKVLELPRPDLKGRAPKLAGVTALIAK